MATYKEQIEMLFDKVYSRIGIKKEDKAAFVEWASKRHTRLKQRDRKWLDKQPQAFQNQSLLADDSVYFKAVYDALLNCDGRDYYTGDKLQWGVTLGKQIVISEKEKRREQITFDHLNGRNLKNLKFVMCSGKTNDAKNDLSQDDFYDLCCKVVKNMTTLAKNTSSSLSNL